MADRRWRRLQVLAMSACNITPITPNKACSGKCRGGACSKTPRMWVVAASGGLISLFEKNAQGTVLPVAEAPAYTFASLEDFQKFMSLSEQRHAFDQLLVVGSSTDIAWVHTALPESSTHHVMAEINYPLLPAWFKSCGADLAKALEQVLIN